MERVLADCQYRGRLASSRRGSRLTRTAWTIWSGCGGRRDSFVQAAAMGVAGDLPTGA
jgi:hypothetical protein